MPQRQIRLALLLFLLAFLAHAPALLGVFPGALPSTGDTLGAFAPWHAFTRHSLAQNGAIPLWNPHLYGGVPFAGNGQSALFYIPTYLHYLLPENLALWLFALLHSYFFMLGGYYLGRTLGVSPRAALLIAVLLGWGNATPAHLFGGHLTFLPARAFWPWQAAFLIRLLRGEAVQTDTKTDTRNALALAACLGLGLAAGAPQIWLFGALLCLLIALFWTFGALKSRFSFAQWPWKSGALALLLTVLWCAPVLLPLRELKGWSSHGEMLSFAQVTDLSATPRSLFRLLFNGFFGGNSFLMWSLPSNPGEDAASIGFAPALLAFIAPLLAPRSRLVRALWCGCAGVLILALGSGTPLYGVLYEHVALFQITRVPARWLELWAFGAAISAGIAFDALLGSPQRARRLLPLWAGAALLGLMLALGVFLSRSPWQSGAQIVAHALNLPAARLPSLAAGLQSEALLSCLMAALPAGLLALLWRRGLASKRQIALVAGLLCVEPLLNFWLGVRVAPPDAVKNSRLPPVLAQKYRAGERWIVRAPFQQLNAPLGAGIDALNGYEPFGSAPFFNFTAQAQPGARFSADFQPRAMNPLWRVMGASHVLWKPTFEGDTPVGFPGKTVARAGEWRLNSITDGLKPWPRAYLTRDFHIADGPQALQILQKLAAQPFETAPPVVISGDFEPLTSPLGFRRPGTVRPVPFRPVPLRALVQTPDLRLWAFDIAAPSLFVESEALAPGWKAFVDDKPAKIHLVNGIFRGVSVPAGSRKIALVYDSQTLRFGLFLGFVGLGVAAFCAVSGRSEFKIGHETTRPTRPATESAPD